jgi:hypothetical protein
MQQQQQHNCPEHDVLLHCFEPPPAASRRVLRLPLPLAQGHFILGQLTEEKRSTSAAYYFWRGMQPSALSVASPNHLVGVLLRCLVYCDITCNFVCHLIKLDIKAQFICEGIEIINHVKE